MPLNILIVGAGVGGPISAFLLLRSNPDHQITVIERHPTLRANGQQIDLRSHGIPMMRRLGLLDAVKAHAVDERGFQLVDENGKVQATMTANGTGEGRQAFTSDYEIMRGDLVNILYEESLKESGKAKGKGGIKYEFGVTVTELTQDDDGGAGVDVTFSNGKQGRYDVVIGADGQYSKTRRQIFGQEVSDACFKPLGVYSTFFSVPAAEGRPEFAQVLHAPGGRMLATRPSRPDITGVYLMKAMGADAEEEEALRASLRQPVEQQKALWAKLYAGAGWQTDGLLREMQASDDFYAFSMAQVRLEHYARGRVALLGDAGYVPSPATGMGTTLSILGAYVLAGELARCDGGGGGGGDVPAALRAYEEAIRPLVRECHDSLPPGYPGTQIPQSALGVSVLRWAAAFIAKFRVDKLITRLVPGNGSWTPPEYPELKLDA
ncbi:hypothetical protein SLS62_005389 [Diatrype stigma]|uniref:FAD-binding domain-containing protein n=1 Tax=Diatrype stigma TaxID=117547 RepID=A0AAN9UUX7_9PEZI